MKTRIALIAHDKKKDDMIALASEYKASSRPASWSPPAPPAAAWPMKSA
jgi:hypothetical protein